MTVFANIRSPVGFFNPLFQSVFNYFDVINCNACYISCCGYCRTILIFVDKAIGMLISVVVSVLKSVLVNILVSMLIVENVDGGS